MYSYTLYTLQNSNHCCLITRTRTTVCMVYTCTNKIIFLLGLCPKLKNEWNKWKNHFSEMKGDVGMSLHEKEREQEDAHPKTESHLTPSLHLCFSLCIILPTGQLNWNSCMQSAKRNKDVGMGLDDFLSLGGHLLVPFLFHEVTSLHPPSSQRNDFSTCVTMFLYLIVW